MTKKFKQFCQLIAIILAIAIPMQCLPLQAIALTPMSESSYVTEGSYDELSDEPIGEVKEPTVLGEDTSRRSEYVKHYILSDKSYRAVVYNEPVHYKKDGAWLEIDSSLSYEEAVDSEDTAGFANKADSFRVKFANNSNSSKLMRIRKGDYELSWGYVKGENTNKSTATPDEQSGKVTYADIEPDTDLIYKVTGSGIKENIVVSSKRDSYSYTFQLKTKGLSLTKNEDGSISANDAVSGETVFTIPAPFMYDAEDRYSNAVEYTLSETNNNKIQLTVTADKEWINSENRAFPVTIDPIIETKQTVNAVDSTMIASSDQYKNHTFSGNGANVIGYESSEYNKSRAIVKINLSAANILQKGDMIVSANLAMHNYRHSFYSSTTPDLYINAHLITENWNFSTVTWNNQPSFESEIYDYAVIENGYSTNGVTKSVWKKWDITEAVKGWIEGTIPNYGILLKQATETANTANAYFHSENNTVSTTPIPLIQINYRSNRGIEDYWSYTSLSSGTAGTASVNNYSGNLVFSAPFFTSPGERLPISLSAIYNGYLSDTYKTVGKDDSSLTYIGRGWRLSIQHTLLPSSKFGLTDTASTYPYVYTDGDGTDHYFVSVTENNNTTLKDEDGLGLVLTVQKNSSGTVTGYKITDDKDGELTFNAAGNVTQIKDNTGDTITVTYLAANTASDANNTTDIAAGTKIKSIQDANGNTYTFEYCINDEETGKTNNYVRSICDESGRKYTLKYDATHLAKIEYPDGTISKFTSNTDTHNLLSVEDNGGYKLSFTHTAKAKQYRVSKIIEYGKNDADTAVLGQTIGFDRSSYNITTIRTAGQDGTYNNDDDIVTYHNFDNWGRTTSTDVRYGGGTHIGSTNSVFTANSEDANTIKQNNRITSSASLGKNTVNLLKNGNAESLSNWSEVSENTTGSVTADSTIYYYGNKSLKITNTAAEAVSNYRSLVQTVNGLTAGGTYTLSAYVRVTDFTQNYTSTYNGAYIGLRALNTADVISIGSICYNTQTATDMDSGWRRISVTITLPTDCTSIRASLNLRNGTGTAYFDGIQLESGNSYHAFNMVANSSFENYTSNLPDNWGTNNIAYSQSGNDIEGISDIRYREGSHSVGIKGDASIKQYYSQSIPVAPKKNDTYIVSAWGRAKAIENTFHSDANFGVAISVVYDNGTGGTYREFKDPIQFNTTINGWQYGSSVIVLKSKENPTYTPLSITVALRYNYQVNYAYFDHIQVIKDVASSYTYDKDGNVVSAAANSEQKSSMKYEDSDLTEVTDSAGYNFKYEYDDNHNVTKATSARGIVSSFTRAIYGGMVKESTLSNPAGTSKIKTETKYTSPVYKSDGTTVDVAYNAYVASTTDQNGYETKYEYNKKKGLLTKVTDPMENETKYTYVNANDDRIKTVEAAERTVTYGYTGDYLSSLSFSSSSRSNVYTFANNAFGSPKYTYINGKMLSNNIYNVKTGQISRVEYGNNWSKKYAYNALGLQNMLSLGLPGSEVGRFTWKYDSKGTLLRYTDYIIDTQYNYTYDAIGRLIRETHLNSNDLTTQKGYVAYSYDLRNNLTKLNLNYGGRSWSNKYSYSAIDGRDETASYAKDNLPTRFTINSAQYADYYYDNLNRITKRVFTFGSGENAKLVNNYLYKYSTEYEKNTTDDVVYRTTQLSTEIIGNTAYGYYYDKNGNITEIKKGVRTGTEIDSTTSGNFATYRTYEYDALNQLTKEISGTTTTTYSYGNLCNMTSRVVTNGSNTTTTTYTYGVDPDSNGDGQSEAGWTNLLLSVTTNGTTQTIDYDAIGNPTSYLGANLTWEGRNLAALSDGTNTISYKYDSNGLRTKKTLNGTNSYYTYVGNKLYYEKNGDKDIYLWYDSYGNLAAVQVYSPQGNMRAFAATNSQGDVLGLYDASGNQIVSYEYDSWGNLISMTDTSAIGIGTINPIRYRGYYFDEETGFYYLQSRYYDPQTGRFINADGYVSTGQGIIGNNPFAYCGNNPVNRADLSGEFWIAAIIIGGLSLGLAMGLSSSDADTNQNWQEHNDKQKVAAKNKFNDKNVNVFIKGEGSIEKEKVNIELDPKHISPQTKRHNPNIKIYDSYLITDRYEQEVIIDIMTSNSLFDKNTFTRSKESYVAEWRWHNFFAKFGIIDYITSKGKTVDLDEEANGIKWDLIVPG